MPYATDHIATALRSARERKGLSQRELSTRAGVPQSHISKIERGAVDLRVSSLIALARTLDLELAMVPRTALTAVQSITRSAAGHARGYAESPRPAYSLDEDDDG
jgi:transcriptional regulator with XRE-family HTH domain